MPRSSYITDLFAPDPLPQQHYSIGEAVFTLLELPGQEEFWMGNNKGEEDSYESEQPKHRRRILPFALAEYPVTQALWIAVYQHAVKQGLTFDKELLRPNPSYFHGGWRPVEQISWNDAQEFCRVLNELLDKPTDYFRLPSEAEWEYAARAGSRDYLYAGSDEPSEVGWNDNNNNRETLTVGLLAPNPFGLYDLSGNVWEWCADDWHGNYEGHPPDSKAWVDAPERAVQRVLRGGSWISDPRYCRCIARFRFTPVDRSWGIGFRLAAPSSDPASSEWRLPGP